MADEIENTLRELIEELLEQFDSRVPETGDFRDLNVGRGVHFGDPETALPGKLQLIVMHMDARLDPRYHYLRFLSVRVMKSREGGYSSSTCLHGRKQELREALEEQLHDPQLLLERVNQLAIGLPEETNPDIWR